jgi:hypothetical protein
VAYRCTRSVRAVCTAVVALLGLAWTGSACTAGGEGDRCTWFPTPSNSIDPNSINGTDECQSGLVCWQAFNIVETGDYDRCCPPILADSTVAACMASGNIDGGNPTSGREGGAGEASTDAKTSDVKASDAKASDAPSDGKGSAHPG